ncbi:HNH endonuclease [Salinisphaera sp. T5B8]|uniref:HNH endonuclease n=1 Tax=Salinisphaera sp. T5B8 TaxID=1304154 RepID=UPI00334149A4
MSIDEDLVRQLSEQLGFSRLLAVAYVNAGGRCEYCGTDLLMARQGYAIQEIDHLVPRSSNPALADHPLNQVLCCRVCNGVKGHFHPAGAGEIEREQFNEQQRREFLSIAREHIASKMHRYDESWRKATQLLQEVWWKHGKYGG